nr:hypothetical protein [Tanacetum cinerariifolium]
LGCAGLGARRGVGGQLGVGEATRRVVTRPAKAAEREAHFAGAVAAVQVQRARAGAAAAIHAQLPAAQGVRFGNDVDNAARAFGIVLGRGR